MAFFNQPHVATKLNVQLIPRGRSGQVDEVYTDDKEFFCLYKVNDGSKESDPKIEFAQSGTIWTEFKILHENDKIRDITNILDGEVIEPGVYLVKEVHRVSDLYGKTHHYICKITGVSN